MLFVAVSVLSSSGMPQMGLGPTLFTPVQFNPLLYVMCFLLELHFYFFSVAAVAKTHITSGYCRPMQVLVLVHYRQPHNAPPRSNPGGSALLRTILILVLLQNTDSNSCAFQRWMKNKPYKIAPGMGAL